MGFNLCNLTTALCNAPATSALAEHLIDSARIEGSSCGGHHVHRGEHTTFSTLEDEWQATPSSR